MRNILAKISSFLCLKSDGFKISGWQKKWFQLSNFVRHYRLPINKSSSGMTLVELMVAIIISAMVIIVASSALVNLLTVNQKAAAKIERRIDLSRAFDFMSYEIRTSRRINSSATAVADGTNTLIENVVTSTGLNLSDLGSYGTMVLYLEIPIIDNPPTTCPVGSPHAGLPPPTPTDYDQVIYDIRPNPSSWLSPRIISRYGRIPRSDGTIDPCEDPVSSDVLVDSISDRDITPTPNCTTPGVLSGGGGFYACVNGGLVDLYMQSKLGDLKTHNLASKAFSRLSTNNTLAAPVLSGTRQTGTNNLNLSWTWTGSNGVTFKLYRVVAGATTEVYSGANLSLTDTLAGNSGDANCYSVIATVGSYTSDYSNQVCETR
ncbi:prepilin-type cleavage/methylation domain-containing protein [Merismopedia glauca CCAP 1448/3]|uniref:Prepilin-type cleavage/methylation domain-containing protein n=2 Tax=Merismopedia TaxID=53402 RepID=A0A2T1C3W5_9CYAN|nr:prepilin-type cleavage/methylation domain-containing protein [Merismopedia glauca CCAP 1448/3]